jgi:hypothetical protein
MIMKCAFCGHKTGNDATHHTTSDDFVCRTCAINFELALHFGDEYTDYLEGKASEELVSRIEAERPTWEAYFPEHKAFTSVETQEMLETSWLELKIESQTDDFRLEIWGMAYDGIRYFWKIIAIKGADDFLAHDRFFDTMGQALDDGMEFLQGQRE